MEDKEYSYMEDYAYSDPTYPDFTFTEYAPYYKYLIEKMKDNDKYLDNTTIDDIVERYVDNVSAEKEIDLSEEETPYYDDELLEEAYEHCTDDQLTTEMKVS